VIGVGLAPGCLDPHMENSINLEGIGGQFPRPAGMASEAAEFLRSNYRPRSGIFTTFGDVTGIFPAGRHPASRHPDMGQLAHWPAAVARPDLFLREEWAVAFGGDPVQSAINRAFLRVQGTLYRRRLW